MRLQDKWLAEIISLLELNGWLKDTIIVVTADHGIRTRVEDPSFEGGKISNYSFNVPLLIYAPNSIHLYTEINHMTSHIDITPTILDLIGIKETNFSMQGSPLWDDRLKHRDTYFLAKNYLGSDGYYDNTYYYMYEHLTGAGYRSNNMNFDENDMLLPENAVMLKKRLNLFYAINERWMSLAPSVIE